MKFIKINSMKNYDNEAFKEESTKQLQNIEINPISH